MIYKPPKPPVTIPKENITTLRIGGLTGRIAHFPSRAKQKQTFLLISGSHSAHERSLSFADFLQDYGEVYILDTPGMGGMNSFTSIGKEISYDSYAEYLYTVLKTLKLTNNVAIFAISMSAQYVTRMFQMYPESQKWTQKLIGFVAFGSYQDFKFSNSKRYRNLAFLSLVASPISGPVLKFLLLNPLSLHIGMTLFARTKKKMRTDDSSLRKNFIQMEKYLWLVNDFRTWAVTLKLMLTKNLRMPDSKKVAVPMYNIITEEDQYFDNERVQESMTGLYEIYKAYTMTLNSHMPSMVSSKEEVAALFDPQMIDEIIKPSKK